MDVKRCLLISITCACMAASEEGLIGWWRFDDGAGNSANDSAGTLHGKISGNPQWTDGKHGGALLLRDDAFVDIGTSAKLELTTDFSVALWMKAAAIAGGSGWVGLVSKYGPGSRGFDINIMTATGNFEIGARGTSQVVGAKIGTPVLDNEWHHIIVVFTGQGFTLYQDGKRTAVKEGVWTPQTSTSSFLIGKRSGVGAFQGIIDEVRVYQRALTEDDVRAEYARIPRAAEAVSAPMKAPPARGIVPVEIDLRTAAVSVKRGLPVVEPLFADGGGDKKAAEIQLRSSTVFEAGNKRLNSREQVSTKPDRDAALKLVIDNQEMASFMAWGSSVTRDMYGWPFKLKEGVSECPLISDEKARTVRWEKPYRLTDTEEAVFTYDVGVRTDGKISITYRHGARTEQHQYMRDFSLFIYFPRYLGQKFTANGKPLSFSAKENLTKEGKELFRGTSVVLAVDAETPERGYVLHIESPLIRITESLDYKGDPGLNMRVDISKDADKILDPIVVLVDLLRSRARVQGGPPPVAGIDFYGNDRITVMPPVTRNLLNNPSFESDLHCFGIQETWGFYQPSTEKIYSVSTESPKFGRKCLKMLARKPALPDQNRDSHLQTFAIPVVPGKKYTFSAWARSSAPGIGLNIGTITGVWPVFPSLGIPESRAVPQDWTRIQGTITAPNNVCSIVFRPWLISGDAPGYLYIDGMQFEDGESASEFTSAPIESVLSTSDPDNFLATGAPIDARLSLSGSGSGNVKITLFNYYYEKLFEKTVPFTCSGETIIRLPFGADIGTGVFVLRADISGNDIPATTDFFRFSVMTPLKNEHPAKNMFASILPIRACRLEDICRRFRDTGIGATDYGSVQKWYWDLIAKYKITDIGVGLIDFNREMPKKFMDPLHAAKKWDSVSPEQEKEVEELCYQITKEYPWVTTWFFDAESEAGGWRLMRDKNVADYATLLVAGGRGARRGNPHAILMPEGGPCNMAPDVGIRQYDQYLSEIGTKMRFDAMAIHPYRAMPEYPGDLDADIGTFIAMLAKHGYGPTTPVHFTEGIYHTLLNVPAWGLSTFKGCSTDHYRAGYVSYDMGWGERMATALFARSWIMALKYWPQVQSFNGWVAYGYMDYDLTPLALAKVPNTLGHLFGDVKFRSDFRPAPGIRGYIFTDPKDRPLMALWSHREDVDRGFSASPELTFRFGNDIPEFIDLMGNERTPAVNGGSITAAASPFPIFLRGKPGTIASFTAAVNSGTLAGDISCPLEVRSVPQADKVLVYIRNQTSREIDAQIELPGGPPAPVRFSGLEERTFTLKNEMETMPGMLHRMMLPVALAVDDKRYRQDVSFEYTIIPKRTITLGDDQWQDIKPITLVNAVDTKKAVDPKSLRARYQFAWDKDYLYLRVSVKDDVFVHERFAKTNNRYLNDTVQVYFDTRADGRFSPKGGYGLDDYSYDLYPDENGQCVVYRWQAPEQQQAGGVLAPKSMMVEPDVRTVFTRTDGGYIIEAAFPQRLILPMRLENGYRAAFGICVNDRDDESDKKNYSGRLTTTPPGTEPGRSPQLYTLMLLAE